MSVSCVSSISGFGKRPKWPGKSLFRLLAYFAFLAAALAAYLTVPLGGFLIVCIASIGFIAFNELMRKNPQPQALRRTVFAAYVLTGATALGTLVAGLPPPAFWVVSAVLPAWQAKRIVARGDLGEAVRMLGVAFSVYAWVLLVALFLPVLLSFR